MRVVAAAEFETPLRRVLPPDAELLLAPSEAERDVVPCLDGAEVLISETFTAGIARAADRLRLIQTTGAGTDGIDFDAIPARATLCNVYGHANAIAEYVIMSVLALSRDLLGMDRRLRSGDWGDRQPRPELRGRTLLIIGFGRIGQALCNYARTFGMHVRAVTRTPEMHHEEAADAGVEYLGGYEALRDQLLLADFVVVAVPATPRTRGLIGSAELQMMRSSAYLVNVGRGAVVDQRPLFDALCSSRIAGAALDVWYQYPNGADTQLPAAYPFQDLPNVIMTPHVAGWSNETTAYRWQTIADNVRCYAAGEPLLNVVRPARNDARTDRPA